MHVKFEDLKCHRRTKYITVVVEWYLYFGSLTVNCMFW